MQKLGKDAAMKRATVSRFGFRCCVISLTFFDLACVRGNVLIAIYLSLHRLENEVIKALIILDKGRNIKQVTFGQEYISTAPYWILIPNTGLFLAIFALYL